MENLTILFILQSSFLFRGLTPLQLAQLAKKSLLKTYQPHSLVLEEDTTTEDIYIILKGLVKVYRITDNGKEVPLAVEKPGNFMGIMELSGQKNSANIETLQHTEVLVIKKKDLLEILGANPSLWKRIYTIIVAKLKDTQQFLTNLLGNSLNERTYLLLIVLSQIFTNGTISLSQETIASLVGATQPRLSEALKELKQKGLIAVSSKKITIL